MHQAAKEVCGTQKLRLPVRITLVAVIIMDWKKDGEQEQREGCKLGGFCSYLEEREWGVGSENGRGNHHM